MTTFFTSDPHYGHTNVIVYANRPFKNVDEMNETLIRNWNSVVSEKDEVWILGDVCMGRLEETTRLLGRLKGHKNLVLGNHDRRSAKLKEFTKHFERIEKYHELTIYDEEAGKKQNIVLCHYPILSWNKMHHGAWHLHGHQHHSVAPDYNSLRLDVGVDGYNYFPISYSQVKNLMSCRKFTAVDHHGR